MRLLILFFATALMASSAQANLELAAFVGASRTHYTTDSGTSINDTNNVKYGGLLLLPILPTLSFRTGLILEDRKMSTDTIEWTDKLYEIPVNLQFNLPSTDAYLFGGLMYYQTQSTECKLTSGGGCSMSKTPNDNGINAGIGYNLMSFALFRLAVEAEYQKGNANLASSGSTKQDNMNLNALFAFGF